MNSDIFETLCEAMHSGTSETSGLPLACKYACEYHTVKDSSFCIALSIVHPCVLIFYIIDTLQALPFRCGICCVGFIGRQDLARHLAMQSHLDFARDLGIFLFGSSDRLSLIMSCFKTLKRERSLNKQQRHVLRRYDLTP